MSKPVLKLPILTWGRAYNRQILTQDLLAALIVTVMLIPQSLAYAMLAGLPAEVGIYASIAPLVLYALLGSSQVLSVGPVAVVSLMTASAIGQFAEAGSALYWQAAMILALMSGAMLLLMGLLRLGFLANFLSHPVISGFISASGLIIAASQIKHLLGVKADGQSVFEILGSLGQQLSAVHLPTLAIGGSALLFLLWVRRYLKPLLLKIGLSVFVADVISKAAPVLAIVATSLIVWQLGTDSGVKIVGSVPSGLPPLMLPQWDAVLWQQLLVPALLISIVGFVESVSVGQTLAAKRRQRIDPNQELLALGASNLSSGLTGGFPVTGGFSRSVVNFDAGAQTPAAGLFTSVGLALAALFLTPALYYLPQATLAATIMVAVLSLVDVKIFKRTWRFAKPDFWALSVTFGLTLLYGVEVGLVAGVSLSLALFLYASSRPHIAIVGLIEGTEHFRNVERHAVQTSQTVLGIRVDESLYFANARYLEDFINQAVAEHQQVRHVILQCSAINHIDASALESLEAIQQRLTAAAIQLHLSEVKGPVMDQLAKTDFLQHLTGQVFLTHYQAVQQLGQSEPEWSI
ncbi:MAG: sulfate permease [Moraxellaceae bacterium]